MSNRAPNRTTIVVTRCGESGMGCPPGDVNVETRMPASRRGVRAAPRTEGLSWKFRISWKFCIAWKLYGLTACFISAGCNVSTLTAREGAGPGRRGRSAPVSITLPVTITASR
jgi:hypothetical protein